MNQIFPRDKFDRWYTVTPGFLSCLYRESPRCEYDALIRTAHHRPTKISNVGRRDSTTIPLALEKDIEAHERRDLQDANPVYPSIAAPARHNHLLKSRFPQQTLTEPFETRGWERPDDLQERHLVVRLFTNSAVIIIYQCVRCFLGFTAGVELPGYFTEQTQRIEAVKIGSTTVLRQPPDSPARRIEEATMHEVESGPLHLVSHARGTALQLFFLLVLRDLQDLNDSVNHFGRGTRSAYLPQHLDNRFEKASECGTFSSRFHGRFFGASGRGLRRRNRQGGNMSSAEPSVEIGPKGLHHPSSAGGGAGTEKAT